ncbi:MAG: 2,3,4,5-tetrahydropyridine-2,6-dicarboxylate N-succinyltransferase, partial [Rubrobacter sp.]|nr:2,3,4,5-tetrahydropyridine-2,6-dicarboxylate N-succinyltransferase [Rubrobacter sp.]
MKDSIEAAFDDRELLKQDEYRQAVLGTIAALDSGEL